jgi:hypothetical protein
MLTSPFHYSVCRSLFLAGIVLAVTSCEKDIASREYEEVVTIQSTQGLGGKQVDPHDFMEQLPPDHPDISSSMQLPEDHPDISSSMQLPAGQDNTELQKALAASVARPPLTWKTPEGWTEEKGSSMRLATFRAEGKNGSIECSIVSLGGQAGGLESNVIRWIRQINAPVPSQDQLKDFLNRQSVIKTDGDFSMTVIDLTELIDPNQEQASSMMGAIAELADQTIFVKMTGSRDAVIENHELFVSLCQSLKMN